MLRDPPIPPSVPKEPADGFGPLKTVLEAISAAYTDDEVRLLPLSQGSPLMNPYAGNCRRQK